MWTARVQTAALQLACLAALRGQAIDFIMLEDFLLRWHCFPLVERGNLARHHDDDPPSNFHRAGPAQKRESGHVTILLRNIDPTNHIGDIPSPCSGVCRMDEYTKLCEGCLRTIDEIAQWSTACEGERRAIWMNIRQRAKGD